MRTAAWALAQVARNRDLRRAELALALFVAAELGSWVAILVYAYDQGGTAETGVAAAVQLVPAALLAPVAGAAGDRIGGVRALTAGYAAQCLTMAATALVLASGAPAWSVYAVAASAASAVTATRPAHALATPGLARSPLELGAANVLTGWITAGMALAAPALVGLILAAADPAAAFAAAAAAVGAATLLALRLPRERREDSPRGAIRDGIHEVAAALHVLTDRPSVRLLVGLAGALSLLIGAVDVLTVTLALGRLDLGPGGPGYLTAAFGAGGVAGAVVTLSLIGRRRLVPYLLTAALVSGLSLVVLGTWPTVAAAFALVATAGAGRILFEVVAQMLLQRVAPPDVLSRVFALAEALAMAGLAAGSLLVPLLVAVGGIRAALVGVGGLLPLLVVLRLRALLAVEEGAVVPVVEIGLLRRLRIFARLPVRELEAVARALVPVELPAGTAVVREGEDGELFYAIAEGSVDVVAGGRPVARLGRGEGFGEIALLHDVPRTATVTAVTNVSLFALARDDFLLALTRHPAARELARGVAADRLDELAKLDAPG